MNTNYSFPTQYSIQDRLPHVFKFPYPTEEDDMKYSFLKFEDKKLLPPDFKPNDQIVKKGTILELSYPDENEQGVFFKFSLDPKLIPSYFSGETVICY